MSCVSCVLIGAWDSLVGTRTQGWGKMSANVTLLDESLVHFVHLVGSTHWELAFNSHIEFSG